MEISIVTDVCLAGNEKLAQLPIDEYIPTRGYGLVHRKGKFPSPHAQHFVKILRHGYLHRAGAERG